MNPRRRSLLIVIGLSLLPGLVQAKTPLVDKRISNVYIQNFKNEGFAYIVDPVAQLCFLQTHRGGVIEIECEALKRRGEWRDIIYWVGGVVKK